jgi:NAD(P)-dependent dehydrogenase (short-subunit alcohol dehydrogenase family)
MSDVLKGQRAIIVGGSSGIGLGSARLLARDGAIVTITARHEDKLKQAQAALAKEGLKVSYAVCDGMNAADVRAAVKAAADDQGRLHIALVVPGMGGFKPVLMFEDDEFGQLVDGNIRPVYLLLKHAGRAMIRAGFGSFIAISSTAAVFSSRYLTPYCTGKAAVDMLVRVAADELGEYNIRVNSVQPGLTRTAVTEGFFQNKPLLDAFHAQQAIKRGGEVNDIAQAVRYFAGPESSWTTGQLLAVDGGHTLRAFPDYRPHMPLPDQREAILAEPVK